MAFEMDSQRELNTVRIVLFVFVMFLVVEFYPVITGLVEGTEAYGLVATAGFFLHFFFMYIAVIGFLKWEQSTSESRRPLTTDDLGASIDDRNFLKNLIIGALAGTIAAGSVLVIASIFNADLRPLNEITADLILNQIIITIPTAFIEELAYRGYMLTRMSRLWGRGIGIIVSSVVFSLFHFNWWFPLGTVPMLLVGLFTLNLFLGGVVLSIGYFYSGEKLWLPVAFHFMWNMIAYLFFLNYPRDTVLMPEIFQIEWGITTVIGFLIGLVVIILALRTSKK